MNKELDTKPKRRWFRFSLRTLLLLTTLVSAGFGWIGNKIRQAQRQKAAVAAIRERGGFVAYDFEKDSEDQYLQLPTPPGPTWLRKLIGDDFFVNVIEVRTYPRAFTIAEEMHSDTVLEHLHGMVRLKTLQLGVTQITDSDLVHLQGLTNLQYLDLAFTKITDAGLSNLYSLTRLKFVELYHTQVTEEGCDELQKALPNLKILR